MRLKHLMWAGGSLAVLAGLLAIASWWDGATGTGRLHVVGVADDNTTLFIDGQQITALARGEHYRTELAQGTHEVTLTRQGGGTQTHALDVDDGHWERVVPAGSQCFAVLDVTEAHYGNGDRPTLVERHFDGAPFAVGGDHFYAASALPGSIRRGHRVHLVAEVPCVLATAPDPAVLDAAGY